jgi:hypothetical protein
MLQEHEDILTPDGLRYIKSKRNESSVDLKLYGLGRSKTLLGDFSKTIKDSGGDAIIMASKFAALPWRTKPELVVKACQASVNQLGGKPIDLYQIHFPNAYVNAKYWDGLAMAYEKGLVKAVGLELRCRCHHCLSQGACQTWHPPCHQPNSVQSLVLTPQNKRIVTDL